MPSSQGSEGGDSSSMRGTTTDFQSICIQVEQVVRRFVMSDNSEGLISLLEGHYQKAMKDKQAMINTLLERKESLHAELQKVELQQDCCKRLSEVIKSLEWNFSCHATKVHSVAAQLTTQDENLLEIQYTEILESWRQKLKQSKTDLIQKLQKEAEACIKENYAYFVAKPRGGSSSSRLKDDFKRADTALQTCEIFRNGPKEMVSHKIKDDLPVLILGVLIREISIAMHESKIDQLASEEKGLNEITTKEMEQEIIVLEKELFELAKQDNNIFHLNLTRVQCKNLLKDTLKMDDPCITEFNDAAYYRCNQLGCNTDSTSSEQETASGQLTVLEEEFKSSLVLQTKKKMNDEKCNFYERQITSSGNVLQRLETELQGHTKQMDSTKTEFERITEEYETVVGSSKEDGSESYKDLETTLDCLSRTISSMKISNTKRECSLKPLGTPPNTIEYKLCFEGNIPRTTSQMSHTEKEIAIDALILGILRRVYNIVDASNYYPRYGRYASGSSGCTKRKMQ